MSTAIKPAPHAETSHRHFCQRACPTSSADPTAITPLRLSRRQLLQAGIMLTAGTMLAACTPRLENLLTPREQTAASDTPIPGREEIQLVYQDWRTDWMPAMVETMLAQFHDEHPDIRVFFTPDPDDLASDMIADMQMGTAPDLFWGSSTLFPSWAQQGYMLDLQPYITRDLDESALRAWDPAQYAAFSLEADHQFGLPKHHGVIGLYYNKDLFDAADVAYPTADWTADAYADAMSRLSDVANSERRQWGSMIDIAWDRLQIYANAWGGHLVAPYNNAICTADRPAATAAFTWLHRQIWDERIMANYADVQYMSPRSAFINQRVAMIEEGSWLLEDILTNSDFRVGVALLPNGPRRRMTLTTTDGFGIYTDTQYPEAAWTLLQFLTSETYGWAMAEAALLQPARNSLLDAWVDLVHAKFPEKANDLDVEVFTDSYRRGYSVTPEIAENMAEVQPRLTNGFELIFTRGQAAVGELQAICAEINNWQGQEPILYPRLHQ